MARYTTKRAVMQRVGFQTGTGSTRAQWARERERPSAPPGARTRWLCLRGGHRFKAAEQRPCPMCSGPVEGMGEA